MYDELIQRLRNEAEFERYLFPHSDNETAAALDEAADAIEDLSEQLDEETEYATALNSYVPQWIPVTERLPEPDTNVLVRSGSFVSVWSLREGDVYWEDEYSYFHDMCEVTHWMPLPQTPKEEK